MGGAATLDGRLFINRHINQPKISCNGGGVADETRLRRNAWGGLFPAVLGWRIGQPKRERKRGRNLGLKRLTLAEPMQQPTQNSTSYVVDIWDEIRPLRNVGGGRLPVNFDSCSRDRKSNGKINSVAVHGHQKTKRHTTTNQKTLSAMGGGVITRCDRGRTFGLKISRRWSGQ